MPQTWNMIQNKGLDGCHCGRRRAWRRCHVKEEEGPGRGATVREEDPGGDDIDTEEESVSIPVTQKDQ